MTDKSDGDNINGRGIFRPPATVFLSGSIDCEEYLMTYPKIGKCYIFNQKSFPSLTNVEERKGTDVDAARLQCRFRSLGYETEVFSDLTVREVNEKLREAGEEDHSNSSSFVCCVLSHGEYGFLYATDGKYPTQNLFAPFRGDACPSLVGKPKMFFIQACQGVDLDSGVKAVFKESLDSNSQFKIPTHADFLIMYSTVPGFFSWRNPKFGSWFIQALCACIDAHARNKDLLSILTIVNRKVAFEFESYTPMNPRRHLKKEMPLITSTLTRTVRFP